MVAARQPGQIPRGVLIGFGCIGAAVLSLLLPSVPSYDPWAWLVWGREITHLDLHTVSGPSWKPLPILFTTPFSVLGSAAPSVWLIVARASTLGAVAVGIALATRITGTRVAGAATGALLLASPWLWAATWTGNSEGILILVLFLAIERALSGRHGQAFSFLVAAGLLRPEAWPFLGLYAAWLFFQAPRRLPWILGGFAAIPALWLLPELWGSGNLFRAADRARLVGDSSPGASTHPALEVLHDALTVPPILVPIGVALWAFAMSLDRTRVKQARVSGGLAAFAGAWIAVVALMSQAGFSGISRYLIAPIGLACVVAGAGYGCSARALWRALPNPRVRIVAVAAVSAAAVAIGAVRFDGDSRVVDQLGHEAAVLHDLGGAIARSGGEARLASCGGVYATYQTTPVLAWTLHRHLAEVAPSGGPPGTIFRTQLILGEPVDPAQDIWVGVPGRMTIARTRYWEVEAACRR